MLLRCSLASESSSFTLRKSSSLSDDRLNSRIYSVRSSTSMILVNQCVIWPPIPKTILIKHSRVKIIAFPFVLFHRDRFFNFCCLFRQRFSAAFRDSSSCHNVFILLSLSGDKPELTPWCLCSLHAGIQMSPNDVVGSRDGCRQSIAESTVDVPIRLFRQIVSARTALFSCPLA